MKRNWGKLKRIVTYIVVVALIWGALPLGVYADDEIVAETISESYDEQVEKAVEEVCSEDTQSDDSQSIEMQTTEEQTAETRITEEQTAEVQDVEEENKGSDIFEAGVVATEAGETNTGTDGSVPDAISVSAQIVGPVNVNDCETQIEEETEKTIQNSLAGNEGDNQNNGEEGEITPTPTSSESTSDGAQNAYSFSFNIDGVSYSAYVYGNGVTSTTCDLLATAYKNRGIGTGFTSIDNSSFTDAEKSSINHRFNVGVDSELCWAYSASNALWQTDWIKKVNAGIFNTEGDVKSGNAAGYFNSEDDISSYAAYNLKDLSGDEQNFWNWLFNGTFGDSSRLKYGLDKDDALLSEYDDAFTKYSISDVTSLNTALTAFSDGKSAATLGIYYSSGGHALSITGFMKNSEGIPVAVIVTDPDNGVEDESQPDDPRYKKNIYTVYPITYNEDGNPIIAEYEDARIGDLSVLKDSIGDKKDYGSIIPNSLKALADSFDTTIEYAFDDDYSFSIPVNADFLSFYDINKVNYRLLDENDTVLTQSYVQTSKSELKELIKNGAVNVTMCFDSILSNLSDGNYKIQVEIDKDCFFGNYGWFAERYNNNEGYFDRLVDVVVKLIRNIIDNDNTDNDDAEYDDSPEDVPGVAEDIPDVAEDIQNAVIDAIINEIVAQIDIDFSDLTEEANQKIVVDSGVNNDGQSMGVTPITQEELKSNVRTIVNDILMAAAKDKATIDKFGEIGIDVSSIDLKNLDVVAYSKIKTSKAGSIIISSNKIKFGINDKVFAMIKLADGTTRYIKAKVLEDGNLSFDIPEGTESITVILVK